MRGSCPNRRARRRRGGALTAAALGAALSVVARAEDGVSLERLVRDFDTVVFFAEHQQVPDPRIRKWTSPIRIYIANLAGDPDLQRSLSTAHARQLAALTALDIGFVDRRTDANLVIVFDRQGSLLESVDRHARKLGAGAEILRDSLCFGEYVFNSRDEIVRAVIGIPSDAAPSKGKLPACIVEEMTQALGLPNDADDVTPSIFNDRSVLDALSEHDRVLVRLLYDPRLPPGLGREEALRRVRRILADAGY